MIIGKALMALVMAAIMNISAPAIEADNTPQYEDLGKCRITCYCPVCNESYGYGSASGKHLEYGDAACGWLPIGTMINIEGEQFIVVDTCGTDAIDIFVDTPDGCQCNLNEYRNVVRVIE